MNMRRREFLAAGGLALAGSMLGCSRPEPTQEYQLESWDLGSGATQNSQTVRLPKVRWEALPASPFGFLLVSARGLLTLSFDGQVHEIPGLCQAFWIGPDLLVAAAKPSGEIYQVGAVQPSSGNWLWKHELGYGKLLGTTDQAFYVSHPQGVSCYDLKDGKELWRNTELVDLKSSFLLPSSLVVGLGNAGQVSWLDLHTGKELRHLTTTKTPNRIILVAGDDEYTLTFTRRIALAGFRAEQIPPIWVQPINSESHQSELLAYSDRIALIELNDSSVAIDIVTGSTLWADALCPRISLCQGAALIRRGRGGSAKMQLELAARQLRSGKTLWQRRIDDLEATTASTKDHFVVLRR